MKSKSIVKPGTIFLYNDGTKNEYTVKRITGKHVIFHTGAVYLLTLIAKWLSTGKLKML